MIIPLCMPSFLPHDLCHGRSSSRWLPTPGELAALLGSRTDPVWRDPLSPVSREAELGSASHHKKGDPGHHRLAVRRHIARPQGDRGKLRGHRQKRPEVPADAGTAQGQRLCAARPGWGDQQSRPGLGPSVGPFLSCAPGPAWPPSLPPRPPACVGSQCEELRPWQRS